jgi:hypothetical protein
MGQNPFAEPLLLHLENRDGTNTFPWLMPSLGFVNSTVMSGTCPGVLKVNVA